LYYIGRQPHSGGTFLGGEFSGAVECSPSQGVGNTTAQPSSPSPSSSSMTGTTQDGDSDGDGIPDPSDKCADNSNPRCYKEEGAR
jgi:hypothetical protein